MNRGKSKSISKIFVVKSTYRSQSDTARYFPTIKNLQSNTLLQDPCKDGKGANLSAKCFGKNGSGDRPRATGVSGSPRPSPRGLAGAHSQGWKARRPAPAHPRLGLAGQAVIQRRHVRAAAPSLLPPSSPRAWQEKRATWSGNKGPRGPRRSRTRCHPTRGPRPPCRLGPAPRPHAPGRGRSLGEDSVDLG